MREWIGRALPARRGWRIALGVFVAMLLLVVVGSFLVEEPLRRYAEAQANEQLPAYHTTIGALTVHPLMLAVDLYDVMIRQQAHPDPALAVVPRIRARVGLLPLLTGTLSADVRLHGPVISATEQQVDAVMHSTDAPAATEADWQDTLRDLWPVRLGLSVISGEVTYLGSQVAEPVRLHVDLAVEGLTNRPPADDPRPANLYLSAAFLNGARLTINGQADPLAIPSPDVQAHVELRELDIEKALKTVGLVDTPVKRGRVEAEGFVDYGPSKQTVRIAHVTVAHPVIEYVNDPEADDAGVPEWQDMVAGLFPMTIDRVLVQEGEILYRPRPKAEPVPLVQLEIKALEISNEVFTPGRYPSELHVSAQLPEQGRLAFAGRADFMAKPLPAAEGEISLQGVGLAGLASAAEPYHVRLRQGALDLAGHVRYAPDDMLIAVNHFLLDGARLDYVHAAQSKKRNPARAKSPDRDAPSLYEDPSVAIKIDHGKILRSEVGIINTTVSPEYRVFMSDMNVELDNVSTRTAEGTGAVKVTGKFMGSGPTVMTGTFRPEKPTPDFDLDVRIIKTDLTAFNQVFRAHGNLDMHEGVFAFFSRITVKDGKVDGYARPFFKDVEVYDPAKDRGKSRLNRAYKAVVDGIVKALKNQPRDEVATHTEVKGPVENPQASTWQIVGNLVQNAFFNAIVPGMEGAT